MKFRLIYPLLMCCLGLVPGLLPPVEAIGVRPAGQLAPASFFGTYTYLNYAILDRETSPEPLPAQGVGGTLTLRPNGTYQKRLTLTANGGPVRFDQEGKFTFSPGRISFTYTDRNGRPRTDEGTFQLAKDQLTLTIAGFPAGNQSIYTLRGQQTK